MVNEVKIDMTLLKHLNVRNDPSSFKCNDSSAFDNGIYVTNHFWIVKIMKPQDSARYAEYKAGFLFHSLVCVCVTQCMFNTLFYSHKFIKFTKRAF